MNRFGFMQLSITDRYDFIRKYAEKDVSDEECDYIIYLYNIISISKYYDASLVIKEFIKGPSYIHIIKNGIISIYNQCIIVHRFFEDNCDSVKINVLWIGNWENCSHYTKYQQELKRCDISIKEINALHNFYNRIRHSDWFKYPKVELLNGFKLCL